MPYANVSVIQDGEPERDTVTEQSSSRPTPTYRDLFSAGLLRPKAACAYLGCGRTKLHFLHETDPTFPRKIRLGARSVGWRKADLDAWLKLKAEQAAGRG